MNKKMNSETYGSRHAKYYDIIDKEKGYDKECDFLEYCFKKYAGRKILSILDLGCGTGVHDTILASRGYEVTGVDISKAMIKIAKSKNIPHSKFWVGNMADFKLGKKYDAVISMFASFGYLNENYQIESALSCIKSHLNSGGIFIMDCWNGLAVMSQKPEARKRIIKRNNIEITRKSHPILKSLEHVCEVNFDIRVKDRRNIEEWKEKHLVRFFFPQEMRKYFEDSGIQLVNICASFKPNSLADESSWWTTFIGKVGK